MPSGASQKGKAPAAQVRESSGNVFKDLGLPDSTQALARAELAGRIVALIAERELTQAEAAKLLGIDQPGVSDLVRGKLKRFSSERLFRFLGALGQDVETRVRPSRKSTSAIRVISDRGPARPSRKRAASATAKRSRKAS